MRQQHGFTLLEMLVALAVFAVLGLMSSQMVTRVLDIHKVAVARGERLGELQRAMQLMQRDVLEIAQRPVRDEMGDAIPSLRIGTDVALELTRSGWRNPLGQQRSELQRVAYLMRDEILYRYYWSVLDRAEDSEPVIQELLRDVTDIEVDAIDVSGNEHAFWPLVGDLQGDPSTKLAAIRVRFNAPPFGEITRVWDVPAEFLAPSAAGPAP